MRWQSRRGIPVTCSATYETALESLGAPPARRRTSTSASARAHPAVDPKVMRPTGAATLATASLPPGSGESV